MRFPETNARLRAFGCRALAVAFAAWLLALPAPAQTLVLTNGAHTFAALTNTSVFLSNRAELHLTGAVPLVNSLVFLASPDTSLALPGVRPSAVVSTHLGQIRINGVPAVADSNCRVVQYAMGAIVLPHAADFRPLTAFAGPYFTGASNTFGQYTYYRGAGLGALNANLRSFRLKRGYAVTFAEQENGTGLSVNYVASDGDLEMAVLPAALAGRVRFIYVAPWRWTSKKGICGDIESGLNVQWKYNWNINQNSTRDLEYVPIRQTRWWPGLNQDWRARGSSHLLGFNEPDRPDQANMSVADAISLWPDLLATGLRVGAPAVADSGRDSWLYPFLAQAEAANLRVDFVPIHYYWCFNPADPAGAANQMYNFLKATYHRVGRPLWVKEWNNGANWTGCGDPTFEQQRAAIAAMIEMMDNAPFVERYALFNWVEDVRRVSWDDGSLTPAGVAYRDNHSPIGYVQALPDNGTRSFTQLGLDGNLRDDSGYGNSGVAAGGHAFTNGMRGRALSFDGEHARVTLPANVARGSAFTFAAWVNWRGGGNWQRVFDFGNSTTRYLFLTPRSGAGTLRFAIRNDGGEQIVETGALAQNQWRHVAVTISGNTARLYVNGAQVAQNTGMTISPASFNPRRNFLGRSQFPADPHFNGLMDEVLITDYALSAAQIAALAANNPPQFTHGMFFLPPATNGFPYTGSIATLATDADPGDTLSFSRPTGPSWLNVAADGTLSGAPTFASGGTNWFTVRVVDAAGQNGFAVAGIPVFVTGGSGAWAADASGVWGDTNRWVGGAVASGPGQTASFATLNLAANRAVTLDTDRLIGALHFSDTAAPSFHWTVTNAADAALTLETGSAAPPAIVVTNTAILALPISGANGFAKSGPGMLVLAGNNSLSGAVNLDTGSASLNDGVTRLASPGALGNASLIRIQNNNSGSSILQIDGASGGVLVGAEMRIASRNNSVPALHNLAGTNVLSGNVLLFQGGNFHTVQAEAGSLLVFTGTNQYVGALVGARSYIFTGAGDHLLVGPILNSTNGSPIAVAKHGGGTLTLDAVNTYTNGTSLGGGTLVVNGSLPPGTFAISTGATLRGRGVVHAPVNLPAGAMLAPGDAARVGALTVHNNVTLQPGSASRFRLHRVTVTNANDQLRVTGALALGGNLVVTNLGGPLWAGDAFRLFDAPVVTGAFATASLPPLPAGLAWRFDAASGVLMVVEPGAPAAAPAPPTTLAAAPGDGLVRLSWLQSATADVVSNRVYRSTAGPDGSFALLAAIPASSAFTDFNAPNGSTFHYVVTAVSPNGESVPSAPAAATPRALGPYAADSDTLLLFHFDGPPGGAVITNHGVLSATPANRRAFAVNLASAAAAPPLLTTVLGAPAFPGFGAAAAFGVNGHLVGWDANDSGAYDGDVDTTTLSADRISLSLLNLGAGAATPWTIEALVFPTNATVNQPRNAQILSTDSSAAARGFQFRLTTGGQLELHFIAGSAGGPAQQLAPIPTTGPHAYAPSNWFHAAAAYDGANVSLYWTRMGAASTAANLLTNYPLNLGPGVGAVAGPLTIGGENRAANTETFLGRIDEVRVSRAARAADGFYWSPPPAAPHAPGNVSAWAAPGGILVSWSAVSNAAAYRVKRSGANTVSHTFLANVTATAFTDTAVAPGQTWSYIVTAVNSAGESLPSLPAFATVPELAPPAIAAATLAGGQLVFAGGGPPNASFHLLSATNLALPLADWDAVQTNLQFAPDGSFTITNPVAPDEPLRFFRLVIPASP